MLKCGNIVQFKTGGPRMKVISVQEDILYYARIDALIEKEIEIRVDSISFYRKWGNFGVR
ncbi:MAG: DUF2158 domain-containing protein [Candidatus Malihini olakiniferum]